MRDVVTRETLQKLINSTMRDVVTRETLLNLINALNRLIAIPPAIEAQTALERLRDLERSPNLNN